MTNNNINNNININIDIEKTASSCTVNFNDIFFSINSTQLLDTLTKNINTDIIDAYRVEDKAIIEATTNSNHVSLNIDADSNIKLISEDRNRVAILIDDEPVTQLIAIKVVDEENNNLKYSLLPQEHSVDVNIEEDVSYAKVTLEIAPHVSYQSRELHHLNRFDGEDYWFNNKLIIKSNSLTKDVEEYCSVPNTTASNYADMPHMITKDIFYRRGYGFYKIENKTSTIINSNKDYYLFKWLYDQYYIGMKVITVSTTITTVYDILTIDLDTFEFTVIDSHSIEGVSKSYASEYYPSIVQESDKEIIFSLHNYASESDLPPVKNTPRLSFAFNKRTLRIDYCNIPVDCIICYKDDSNILYTNLRSGGLYLNNKSIHGSTYLLKPLTSIKNNILYLHDYSYSSTSTSELYVLDLSTSSISRRNTIFARYYCVTSTVNLVTNTASSSSYENAYVLMHDTESLNNRLIEELTQDDIIAPEEVTISSTSAMIKPGQHVFIKKDALFNKRMFYYGSDLSFIQRGKYVAIGNLFDTNSDLEIKNETMSTIHLYYKMGSAIISDSSNYKFIDFYQDLKRLVTSSNYELMPKGLDKVDGLYHPLFESYGDAVEDFEGNLKLDWSTNYGESPFTVKTGPNGTTCGFMGSTKGNSKLWSEFTTISPQVEFDYMVSSEENYDWFRVYVNGIKKFEASGTTMTTMQHKSIELDSAIESTIKFAYENDGSGNSGDSGFYIDNITANAKVSSSTCTIDFEAVDYGMYSSPQGVSISFNDLNMSDNLTCEMLYTIDNENSWETFIDSIPNKDNVLLRAVFSKPTVEEEASLYFKDVTVTPGEMEVVILSTTSRQIKRDVSFAASSLRIATNSAIKALDTARAVISQSIYSASIDTLRKVCKFFNHSMSNDTKRTINKTASIGSKTKRIVHKDTLVDKDILRKVTVPDASILDTDRQIIKQSSTKINVDTYREVIKNMTNNPILIRRVSINKTKDVVMTRAIAKSNVNSLDTNRVVNALFIINKYVDTKRRVYKPGALYVTQLTTYLKFIDGKMIIVNQEFKH